jgi:hypothetical protein
LLDAAFQILADEPLPGVMGFFHGNRPGPKAVLQEWALPDRSGNIPLQASLSFRLAGHSLFAILAGYLGSWAARVQFRRYERESAAR